MSKKVIVVGFGFMGQTHARNIANHPNLELAAIVDAIDPKIAMKKSTGNFATDTLGEEIISKVPYYKELTEAIAEVKPDAVVVATPTMLHYKFAKIVLDAGCNLFLEKPICLDPNLCDELVALAESKHLVFMAGHCVRFHQGAGRKADLRQTRLFPLLTLLWSPWLGLLDRPRSLRQVGRRHVRHGYP